MLLMLLMLLSQVTRNPARPADSSVDTIQPRKDAPFSVKTDGASRRTAAKVSQFIDDQNVDV